MPKQNPLRPGLIETEQCPAQQRLNTDCLRVNCHPPWTYNATALDIRRCLAIETSTDQTPSVHERRDKRIYLTSSLRRLAYRSQPEFSHSYALLTGNELPSAGPGASVTVLQRRNATQLGNKHLPHYFNLWVAYTTGDVIVTSQRAAGPTWKATPAREKTESFKVIDRGRHGGNIRSRCAIESKIFFIEIAGGIRYDAARALAASLA